MNELHQRQERLIQELSLLRQKWKQAEIRKGMVQSKEPGGAMNPSAISPVPSAASPISAAFLERTLRLLAWGSVIGFMVANLWILFPRLQREVRFTLENSDLTAAQKLELPQTYAQSFDLAELIIQTTPGTSTILIPDFNDPELRWIWHDASNAYLMTGFLYPRTVKYASSTNWSMIGQSSQRDVFIVVLSRARDGRTYTWPAKRPPEQNIIYASSGGWGYAPVSR